MTTLDSNQLDEIPTLEQAWTKAWCMTNALEDDVESLTERLRALKTAMADASSDNGDCYSSKDDEAADLVMIDRLRTRFDAQATDIYIAAESFEILAGHMRKLNSQRTS